MVAADRGRGRELDPTLRELLCDIRREYPSVSVPLVLRTLRADGRIGPEVTACTVRRMLAERGLARTVDVAAAGGKARLRWQAERPGALWHGDVCHGPTCVLRALRRAAAYTRAAPLNIPLWTPPSARP